MSSIDWHGWGRRGSSQGALHVGRMPGRKSVCLYTNVGNEAKVRAYFRSEADAVAVLAWLDNFAGEDAPVHITIIKDAS